MSKESLTSHLELIAATSQTLNKPSAMIPIDDISSSETQWLIDELLSIANDTQGDKNRRTVVGLAAPQAGVNKRVIVVDVATTGLGEPPELRVYINPEITAASQDDIPGREGCFSTGNICGIVPRSREITLQAYDRKGNIILQTFDGFTARIFQHEIDHLDGIRFPDRIAEDSNLHWVEPEQFGEYREHWASWKVHCPRTKWEALKIGTTNKQIII